ncbi:uncharacterized protein LOC134687657 [Mytilus trossulus]|uniref:uncharacterized protein LOC134687657 n=1 Tax=Mytilus trossulus TaxID=6551 RepID=UPI003006EF1C
MASNWSNCGICDFCQITKPSEVWCSECDEGLCGDCNEHQKNVRRIRTNREYNLKSLEIERGEIEAEIKQTRIKLTNHLDKLQDEAMKELMRAEQTQSENLQKLLTTLKAKETEIAEYQTNIGNFKQHASDLQTFLAIKHIEKDLKVKKKSIQSITESVITNQVNISCQLNKSLQQITENNSKFAEISIRSVRCDLFIQKQKERQAQIMVALPARNIDNLALTLQKRIRTKLTNVTGCYKLRDERMIFSCNTPQKISIFNSDGSEDFKINYIDETGDAVFIGDDSLAVTTDDSNTINIIDLKKQKLKKSIRVNSNTGGVVYKDGHLIYCAREKGLKMISLSDESITNVSNNKITHCSYVATFGDKLLYTNCNDHSVTCCDYHGYILWTFCDKSVLEYPVGISVDSDGNVFVAGQYTHNIVVISPDGKRCRQLLSREDGLKGPQVLHYDTSTNTLLVANQYNNAFLYELK